jgi:excisionase family DNA binding protein
MSTTNMQEQFFRVSEVARQLAISRSKVYQLMDVGQLAYTKFGKSRRIRWSDIQKLINENTISRS